MEARWRKVLRILGAGKPVQAPAPGKPYWKKHYVGWTPLAHFMAQPSKYAQPMDWTLKAGAEPAIRHIADRVRVRWVGGRTLASMARMRRRQKLAVIGQLADAVAEHVRLGIIHGDMNPKNIIVSGRARPRVRLIDYGQAEPTEEVLANVYLIGDYRRVRDEVIPHIAGKSPRRTRELQGYFEKRFLRMIESKF